MKYFTGLFFLACINLLNSQSLDSKNWFHSSEGLRTDKAYRVVKNKPTTTVIVAVIDSGVDIEHEDLKGKIWTNQKEIPGNGIDDDNNGFIDDVHGWNFLGNSNGQNQLMARLEKTRIVYELRDKYERLEEKQIRKEDWLEYQTYLKAKKEHKEEVDNYTNYKSQYDQLNMVLKYVPSIISEKLNKKEYTKKDIENWKVFTEEEIQLKDLALAIENKELTEESIKEQAKQIDDMLEYSLNLSYDDRKNVGDNPYDFSQTIYGNNDVEGPDALHGTHVAGIIAANRGNNIGIDGIANDVLIMSVRAIPNGDEHDKDVALAIRYAVDNGANIINMSFGKAFSPNKKEVFQAMKYAESKDVLIVHAAGNDGENIDINPNYPMRKFKEEDSVSLFLTVGASTNNIKRLAADFSNYGRNVDLFAPGKDIYSLVPQSQYKKLDGTSMASPMVAGAAAFLKSYYPNLSMSEIKSAIEKSVRNYSNKTSLLPSGLYSSYFRDFCRTAGVLDLFNAIKFCEK